MMAELCGQDVVVQITPITPQILTTEGAGSGRGVVGAGGAGELGRRLLAAARAGDTALVLELMGQGAAFTADWLGTSPLHAAAAGAHADTCAVLLRAGVSRDCRTKVERTPLHEAAAAGHARVVALLLAHGAAPDAADMLRMTPLHWAAERGHAAVVRLLLRHGADPTLRSKFLLTPRELAARRRHADVVRLLEEAAREREADATRPDPAAAPDPTPTSPVEQISSPLESQGRRPQRASLPSQPADPIKIKMEKTEVRATFDRGGGGEAEGAALLRAHGITLLPPDAGSTVLSALQSGRSVVLSDAGKLMLKESVSSVNKTTPVGVGVGGAVGARGVVLTATPVRDTPRGVKVFTLNNKSIAMPKENKTPVKKVVNPQDMQIKLVQGGGDARRASPLKAKRGAAVKIIMHKANFDKMVAAPGVAGAPGVTGASTVAALAAELRAARDELQQTRAELQHTRDELRRTQELLRQYRPDEHSI